MAVAGVVLRLGGQRQLLDVPLGVRVEGVEALGEVVVEVSSVDAVGVRWSSVGTFVASGSGVVDSRVDASVAGSYVGVDAWGLVWSLRSEVPVGARYAFGPEGEMVLGVRATVKGYAGPPVVVEGSVRRSYRAGPVGAGPEGTVSRLYLPEVTPAPGVVVLGGSDGGVPDARASLLAARGFVTLALAYFGVEGLPSELLRIPVEPVVGAVSWLAGHEAVSGSRVAVVGLSRGAELGLLVGSLCPEVSSVVGLAPSSILHPAVTGARDGGPQPAWTSGGRGLPMAVPTQPPPLPGSATGPLRLRSMFLSCFADEQGAERAAIPVERINGPLLLVAGEDDQLWPSGPFAERVLARRHAAGVADRDEYVYVPGAGHSVGQPPGLPFTRRYLLHPISRTVLDLGGDHRADANGALQAWDAMLRFLAAEAAS